MNKLSLLGLTTNILLDHCPLIARYKIPYKNTALSICVSEVGVLWHSRCCNVRFESNVNNRKQFVSIRGTSSEFQTVTFDVPHGSALGLLLFLVD